MTPPLRLKRNTLSNFAGLMIVSLLPLVASILYVPLLGMERYGIVGAASFLLILGVSLDFGIARTVTQKFARTLTEQPPGAKTREAGEVLRAAFVLYMPIAGLLGAAVAGGSWYLTQNWLVIPPALQAEAQHALLLTGLTLVPHCLRVMPIAALNGLERQGLSNLLQTGTLAFRLAVSLIVLEGFEATLEALMTVWLLSSLAECLLIFWVTRRCLRDFDVSYWGPFRWATVREIGRVSRSDGTSALVSLANNFADKLILSRLLPIDLFGLYQVLSLLGSSLNRLTAPLGFAAFPRWIAYQSEGDRAAFSSSYHAASQAAAALILPTMVAGLIFAPLVLSVLFPSALIPPDLILAFRLMVLSGAANALGFLPYMAQLAAGSTALILRFALISGALYLPLVLIATPTFGLFLPIGARLALDVGTFLVFSIAVHRDILPGDGTRWARDSLLAPLAGLTLPFALGGLWLAEAPHSLGSFVGAVTVGLLGIAGALFATPTGRRQIAHLFRRWRVFPRGRG